MVKYQLKKFKWFIYLRTSVLQCGSPECYHWATQDNTLLYVITPLTQLMKTHVTALLSRPTFINSSATHNLSGWPFSSKNQRRLLPCFLYKSFFCGCDNTPIWHIHYCIYTIYINEERCKLFSWQSPFHNMTGQKYWRHTKVSVRNFAKL